ncbi:hypothetical protein J2T20_002459 [Paenibacillus wynnii]|nr:hypothetical protein [Paenibacillus wynnii]
MLLVTGRDMILSYRGALSFGKRHFLTPTGMLRYSPLMLFFSVQDIYRKNQASFGGQ